MDEHFELLENHLKSKNDVVGLIKLEWLKRETYEAIKKYTDGYDEILAVLLSKDNKQEII